MNIRIINIDGKYTLRFCLVDDDQVVEKVLEEVELKASSFGELRDLLSGIDEARKQPCVVVNAGNKAMLRG